jgi:hypothetical protein
VGACLTAGDFVALPALFRHPLGRTSGEHFDEYLLDDGVILRIKHVLTEVWKARDAYDSYGNPLYFVVQSPILAVDAPDELREGGDEE